MDDRLTRLEDKLDRIKELHSELESAKLRIAQLEGGTN